MPITMTQMLLRGAADEALLLAGVEALLAGVEVLLAGVEAGDVEDDEDKDVAASATVAIAKRRSGLLFLRKNSALTMT